MSTKKNQNSSEVVASSDETTQIEESPTQADLSPLSAKIASLPELQQNMVSAFQFAKTIFVGDKVENDAFKLFTQNAGLFETSTNQAEVDKLQTEIDKVKSALSAAGFAEDNPIVVSAIKGLTAELTKAQGQVKDNLAELATYFGVKLAKVQGGRVYASTGEFAVKPMTTEEIKAADFIFKQNDKKAIVIHSQTVSESDLTKIGAKADSQTWLAFEYNGLLDYTKNTNSDRWVMGDIKSIPENWMKVHSVVCTTGTLSGLMGVVAATLGEKYNGQGWQSNTMLNKKFDKVNRVVKA